MGKLLKTKKDEKKFITSIVGILMFVFGVLMIFPFLIMISAAFKYPSDVFVNPLQLIPERITLKNYEYLFKYKYFIIWYANTIKTVCFTIILRTAVVSIAAYAFAKMKFRGKNFLFLCLIATMMIVPDTTIVPRYLIYKQIGLLNTHWAIILPSMFDVFFVFLLRQFFMGIPHEFTEAAIIDGCSHFSIYYRIALPLAKPAMVTMVLFSFLWTWNNYIDPYIFISNRDVQLISVGLQYFQSEQGANYALQMAGASMAVIPSIILFIVTQKYFIQGVSSSGVKG